MRRLLSPKLRKEKPYAKQWLDENWSWSSVWGRWWDYSPAWNPDSHLPYFLPMRTPLSIVMSLVLFGACGDDGDDGGSPPDASTATVDAMPSGGADAMPGGALQFMQACDPTNDMCDSAMNLTCFSFNNKGPHCTHSCQGDSDCAAPSPGCNGMGVCKAP